MRKQAILLIFYPQNSISQKEEKCCVWCSVAGCLIWAQNELGKAVLCV